MSDRAVARHQRQIVRLGRRHDEPVPRIGEKRAGDQREGVNYRDVDHVEVHVGRSVEFARNRVRSSALRACVVWVMYQRSTRHHDAVALFGLRQRCLPVPESRDEPWTYQTMAWESATTLT